MTTPKKFVFVLMPFEESFDDIYNFGIKQTCISLNAYCERVDEQIFHERILDRIYNQIAKADILIADMTGRNANVFYEVGYAHGLGKKVILLTQNSDDIPFDLKHFPHIIYDGKIKSLQDSLKSRLDIFLNEDITNESVYDFPLEFLVEGERIEENKIFEVSAASGWGSNHVHLKIDIFNTSDKIFKSKIQIGIETHSSYGDLVLGEKNFKPSPSRILSISPEILEIYPKFYNQVIFNIETWDKYSQIFECQLKIFTDYGLRILNFKIKVEDKEEIPWR